MEDYWDVLAEEAKSEENAKSDEEFSFKNWVTEYADAKAKDLIFTTFGSFISLDSGAKVLDIACGLGKWTRLYAEKGFFTIGVDASA
jgi:2-polyprenyl-3-methyl-5-hydroxy-6-metoxy-1,4-benzoquinol methylase